MNDDDYYFQDTCLTKINMCQNEISILNPNDYYTKAYKNAERYYWHHIPEWIYKDSIDSKVTNCLDIGCAYGTLALYCKTLLDCKIYCTDFIDSCISKTLIDKYEFTFNVNNIELDPFPWKKRFDMIIFTEVLEHLNFHPLPTLKKIYSLLKDDGHFYLSTPDASSWGKSTNYYSCLDDMSYPLKDSSIINDHIYIFDKYELVNILLETGFKIKRFDYASGLMGKQHFNLTLTK